MTKHVPNQREERMEELLRESLRHCIFSQELPITTGEEVKDWMYRVQQFLGPEPRKDKQE